MTLEDLEETLPNGLHDAQIRSMKHDFESGTVKLQVRLLFGVPDDPPETRHSYRDAEVVFYRVLFFASEIPKPESAFRSPRRIWFQVYPMEPGVLSEQLLKTLPADTQCYSLFVNDWYCSIHIAAGDVSFSWDVS